MIVRCCPLKYITTDVWHLLEEVALSGGRMSLAERADLPYPYQQAFTHAWSHRAMRKAAEEAKHRG